MGMIETVPLKRGEYDLVNISAIGFDPVTGRTADECIAEHQAAVERVLTRARTLRWWDLVGRSTIARQYSILRTRQSCAAPFTV
jgi:hypothetical protein